MLKLALVLHFLLWGFLRISVLLEILRFMKLRLFHQFHQIDDQPAIKIFVRHFPAAKRRSVVSLRFTFSSIRICNKKKWATNLKNFFTFSTVDLFLNSTVLVKLHNCTILFTDVFIRRKFCKYFRIYQHINKILKSVKSLEINRKLFFC